MDNNLDQPDESLRDLVFQHPLFLGGENLDRSRLAALVTKAREATQITLDTYAYLPKRFNFLQTHHSVVFLYKLAKLLHQEGFDAAICDRIFLLNKVLNGVDLYYRIDMPEHFIIGHGLGIVFSRATYGNHLVVFQNTTIGSQDGTYPVIGERVVIYPNCLIIGKCHIGSNSVVGAGTRLIHKSVPDDSVAFEKDGKLHIKENTRREIEKYFAVGPMKISSR